MLTRRSGRPSGIEALVRQAFTVVPPWALVLGWTVAVYLWVNVARAALLAPEISVYLFQPLLWLSLGAVSYVGWRLALTERPRAVPRLVLTGALVGAFHVALLLLAGMAFGFGASPLGHSPLVLLGNLVYLGSMLVSVELARALLLARAARRPAAAIILTSVFFALLNVPLARWAEAADAPGLGRLAGEVLLPGFSENLLASFLSLAGGPAPALAYRAVLHSFEWLSPILPRLPWAATAFIGVLGPALGLALAQRALQPRADGERGARGLPLPILGLAAVALLWFNVGLFGVQPTLVSGVSMEPALQAGDIVIVRQVPAEQIAVGDVIRFRHEGVHVVHRVVEIQETQEGWVFVTRGDANDVLDPPLTEDRVEGVVVAVIPKVGWVAIAARQLIGANR